MDYSTPVLTVIESRPDWITATCTVGDRAWGLRDLAMRWAEEAEETGNRAKPWKQLGYRGFSCGGIRWGEGREGVIVQVSGSDAAQHDQELAQHADHWSRVDYCVTCWDETALARPLRAYKRSLAAAVRAGTELSKVTSIETLQGGSSLYIGSRASGRYLRCYDKGSESPTEYAAGSWRWEVEYKRELSEAMQMRHQQGFGSQLEICCQLSAEFARHHLAVPWPETMQLELPGADRRTRDVETVLKWIETQVGPSARWLAGRRGWDTIMSALKGAEAPGRGERGTDG
jgi:DNA relaxase NicK